MRVLASIAALLFSTQALLCGLRGFGIVESLNDSTPSARAGSMHAGSPGGAPGHGAHHCGPQGGEDEGQRGAGDPADDRCRRHCRLYAQSIPPESPRSPLPAPGTGALAHQFEVAHPWRAALPLEPGLRAPPRTRELPILHAALLI